MISRVVAVPGLVCMLAIGRGLLSGSLSIATAGGRALVLMAVLWSVDRMVVPLVAEVLRPPQRRRTDGDGAAGSPTIPTS